MITRRGDLITSRVNRRAFWWLKCQKFIDHWHRRSTQRIFIDLPKVWWIGSLTQSQPTKKKLIAMRQTSRQVWNMFMSTSIDRVVLMNWAWDWVENKNLPEEQDLASVWHMRSITYALLAWYFSKSSQTCQNKQTDRSTFVFNMYLHFVCV